MQLTKKKLKIAEFCDDSHCKYYINRILAGRYEQNRMHVRSWWRFVENTRGSSSSMQIFLFFILQPIVRQFVACVTTIVTGPNRRETYVLNRVNIARGPTIGGPSKYNIV